MVNETMLKNIYILHGWAVRSGNLNQEKWQPFFNELEKFGINAVFLKIPGLSSPLNEVWDLDNYVSWLKDELKEKQKGKKVILLGHSFGGQIAIKFTAQNPDLVKNLILLDSAGIRDMSLKAVIKRTVFLIAAKVGKILFKSEVLRNILYKFAGESDYKNAPPLLRRTMSNILDAEILDDLSKINVKTKIVWGNKDTVTPVKTAHQMNNLIKNSDLSFIKDARHSPHFTHVKETAKVVGEFITGEVN
jgi:pimeloyl-ACP methyl ester carboxylesterase